MALLGVFLRGLLMGAADIVPGISGGTIAFITGIYDTLLASIRAFDLTLLRLLLKGELQNAWRHVNGSFLAALLLGIATSMFSLAQVISWLLDTYPVLLWAFFFGLILASALVLLRQVTQWSVSLVASLATGVAVATAVGLSPVVGLDVGLGGVFLAGFISICAMILPGISGSFILVLLGMYGALIGAIKDVELQFLTVFIAGAVAGLLCFSRLLHWLLQRFHQHTMSLLTGFLLGSLGIVWPWKRVLDWVEDSRGELKAAQQVPISPGEFQALTGQDPSLWPSLGLMVLGFVLVWVIDASLSRRPSGA